MSRVGLAKFMLFLGRILGQHDFDRVDQANDLTRLISPVELAPLARRGLSSFKRWQYRIENPIDAHVNNDLSHQVSRCRPGQKGKGAVKQNT